MKKKIKFFGILIIITIMSLLLCFFIDKFHINNLETLKNIVNEKWTGSLIYILLLTIQVVCIPINALILIIPAIVLFGAVKTFILSFIGLILGSVISYILGYIFGTSILKFFAEENYEKWQNILNGGYKWLFPILMLIPVFPDELLCLLSGIGKINFPYYFAVILITRAIDLGCICFIGSTLVLSPNLLTILLVVVAITVIISFFIPKKAKDKVIDILLKKHKKNEISQRF